MGQMCEEEKISKYITTSRDLDILFPSSWDD